MSKTPKHNFVVTREYRRFAEFCDACRRYRYIGLCYGPPGVGKTLSARRYANWEQLESIHFWRDVAAAEIELLLGQCTVLYTPTVVNTPGQVERDTTVLRQKLRDLHCEPLHREEEALIERVRRYEVQRKRELAERLLQHNWLEGPPVEPPRTEPTCGDVGYEYQQKRRQIADPTSLLIVDEADRLKMASLEQMRAIFDQGGIGLVLLGMPGLEKRLIRYPQLYSRVGFVHEFRPLNAEEVRLLLEQHWQPLEVCQPLNGITDTEVLIAIVRITGGNFRLLHRLLSQVARVMEVNALATVTLQAVEAARESLVIGTA